MHIAPKGVHSPVAVAANKKVSAKKISLPTVFNAVLESLAKKTESKIETKTQKKVDTANLTKKNQSAAVVSDQRQQPIKKKQIEQRFPKEQRPQEGERAVPVPHENLIPQQQPNRPIEQHAEQVLTVQDPVPYAATEKKVSDTKKQDQVHSMQQVAQQAPQIPQNVREVDSIQQQKIQPKQKNRTIVEVQNFRPVETQQKAVEQHIITEVKQPSMTVDLNKTLLPEGPPTVESSFEELLTKELRQDLGASLVRQAQIIIRNADSGTIRLSLQPESLGKVKVHIEMVENKITGHIMVESTEALRAFEREVHSLEQAFRDSGFQSAELHTSLASDGQNGQRQKQTESPFFSARLAVTQYSLNEETLDSVDSQVNIII
ncbi:MAG: flagellar hook-length control protein FliK [Treponema sp.]|jgi:flagellar hook-length control protein FliK|nr:flagellar hook-length control protein FliK [Treponema sp.]